MELNEEQKQAINHIDGPCMVVSSPGSGKCISGDSYIFSPDKIMTQIENNDIKNIYSFSKEKINFSDMEEKKISKFVKFNNADTIRISTKHGFCLEGTPEHPILVINKNSGYLSWKKLEDLEVGDICPIYNNKKYCNKNKLFDEDFYIMGLLIGDGYIAGEINEECKCVRKCYFKFSQEKNNIYDIFIEFFKKKFDYKCPCCKDKRRKNLYAINVYNKFSYKYFEEKFGAISKRSRNKILTKEMLSGSSFQIASLLRGIFDTDGYVDLASVGLTLGSKILIDQIHILLLNFGIFSYKKERIVKGNPYYTIAIYGNDMRRFYDNIGFFHTRKKEKLEIKIKKKSNPNKVFNYQNFILKEIIEDIRRKKFSWCSERILRAKDNELYFYFKRYIKIGNFTKEYTRNNIRKLTEKSIDILLEICKDHKYYHKNLDYLSFIKNNFTFSEIRSIEKDRKADVYDYVIDETHNFISNGFISHNTTVITERTINLINLGINPSSIICMTFTNKAAKEMKDRILSRINQDVKMYIGTFHSLCANLLRIYYEQAGYTSPISIIDDSDQKDLIEKILRQMGIDKKEHNIDVSYIADYLNKSRENLFTEGKIIEDMQDYTYSQIISEYFKQLKENNLCDFSGLLYNIVGLMENNKEVLDKLQGYFKYIQVDEFQDCNLAQYKIIKLLAGETKNIFMVGDISQSIYRFRGARYENILDFIEEYKCKQIPLGTNYRSTPEIVANSEKIIKNNKSHIPIKFSTVNPSGSPVICRGFFDSTEEAQAIADEIKKYVYELGWSFSDVAIFYRLNKLSLDLQSVMSNSGVPYTVIGGQNFFDRKEIRDAIALLRFASNNKDILAFHRIASILPGLGDISIGKIENESKKNNISILEACNKLENFSLRASAIKASKKIYEIYSKNLAKLNAGDCLSYLINQFDYTEHLNKTCKKEEEAFDRVNNINELITNATEFSKTNSSIDAYLQNISLISASDKENGGNSVTLQTIHSAKGLEYPIVFIVGVEQGILPH